MRYPREHSMRLALVLAGTIAAAWAMTACASGQATRHMARDDRGLDRPTDETITRWVEAGLRLDPRVSLSDVTVRTLNGIVKLRGTVNSLQEKRYAKMEAKKIDGVRGVIDVLSVRPTERTDSQIKEDVVKRLTQNPGVRSEDLSVIVTEGAVTLRGKVSTWNELNYANILAGEVRGVRDVFNEMALTFENPRTDEQNRDEIVAAIDRDPYLTGLPITVKVADGVATLDGTVGNAYEKDRAESDAFRVASVGLVDNRLDVDWIKDRGVRDGQPAVTDHQIERAVRDALDQDLRLTQPGDITIKVADRDVTLNGVAPDYYQKTIARRDARDVVGTREVFDFVDIDISHRDDDAVAYALQRSLTTDYALGDRNIGVFVDDGMATITGVVPSMFDKAHAEDVATSVLGVRGVINDIVVRPVVGYSDEALKEGIESRLSANWLTRSIAPRVHVVVEDGSATLTGDVDSWTERVEAGRVTRLVSGVTGVTNDLTVGDTQFPAISRLNRPDDGGFDD